MIGHMPCRSGSPHAVRGCCQPEASEARVSALPVGADSEHAASASAAATRLKAAIRSLITTSTGPLGHRTAWPPHPRDATKVSFRTPLLAQRAKPPPPAPRRSIRLPRLAREPCIVRTLRSSGARGNVMRAAHRVIGVGLALALTACGGAPDQTSSPAPVPRASVAPGDWPLINRDLNANRYSPLNEITTANVATLAPSWTYKLGGNSTAVPIVVGGVMYLPSRDRVIALDGDSGALVWEYVLPAPPAPPAGTTAPPRAGAGGGGGGGPGGGGPGGGGPTASTRGVSYWPGDGTLPPRILFMSRANLIALDAATGT